MLDSLFGKYSNEYKKWDSFFGNIISNMVACMTLLQTIFEEHSKQKLSKFQK